jgi:hypothetical protein
MAEKIVKVGREADSPEGKRIEKNKEMDSTKDEYYNQGHSKFLDFCIGFFGLVIIETITYGIYALIIFGIDRSSIFSSIFGMAFSFIGTALFALAIVLIVYSFKKKRRFIGIGMIVVLVIEALIPLLVFGACLIAFGTGGF